MITKQEIDCLYQWAKETTFPTKNAPTTRGYSNKNIHHYWIKSTAKIILIRKKLMTDRILDIYQNNEILYSGYSIFQPGTILKPHKDPSIYREPYKRIQIPIDIPEKEKCYMTWNNKKIYWENGIYQVFDVVNNIHDAGNLSNKPMKILFVDVKMNTIVE